MEKKKAKKWRLVLLVFTVLLGAYSACAWWSLRGTRAYRLYTGWGAAFAHSLPFTAGGTVLAVCVLFCYAVSLLRKKHGGNKASPQNTIEERAGTEPAAYAGEETAESAAETGAKNAAGKIPPRKGRLAESGEEIPEAERFFSVALLACQSVSEEPPDAMERGPQFSGFRLFSSKFISRKEPLSRKLRDEKETAQPTAADSTDGRERAADDVPAFTGRYCKYCGGKMEKGWKFCKFCGKPSEGGGKP